MKFKKFLEVLPFCHFTIMLELVPKTKKDSNESFFLEVNL